MARYLGPKHKICRREGIPLCGSGNCPVLKRSNPPGIHGRRGRRKLSDFGLQLREKQKAKRIYGILDRQFRRYFNLAKRKKAQTGEVLFQLLETRLDNLVYRLGFAPSRNAARQLVSHQHILVNSGVKVDIPSFNVEPGQTITLTERGLKIPLVHNTLAATKKDELPKWLERKGPVGRLIRFPTREEIGEPIDEKLIIEYFSR